MLSPAAALGGRSPSLSMRMAACSTMSGLSQPPSRMSSSSRLFAPCSHRHVATAFMQAAKHAAIPPACQLQQRPAITRQPQRLMQAPSRQLRIPRASSASRLFGARQPPPCSHTVLAGTKHAGKCQLLTAALQKATAWRPARAVAPGGLTACSNHRRARLRAAGSKQQPGVQGRAGNNVAGWQADSARCQASECLLTHPKMLPPWNAPP